jgi:hypothetical protein
MSTIVATNDGYFENGTPYWAYNNTWGAGSLQYGVGYTQTITVDPIAFPNGTTLAWSYPSYGSPSGIWAYPEIIYGASGANGWYGTNGTIQPFSMYGLGGNSPAPTQVSNLNLTASYAITPGGNTQDYDVIFDTNLTFGPPNGWNTVTDKELEFVVYANQIGVN